MRISAKDLEEMKRSEPLHKTREIPTARGLPAKRTHEFKKYIVHEVIDWDGNAIYDKQVRGEE